MSDGEFEIIERYFAARPPERADVLVGVGDDCAILAVPPGRQLAVSVDTMVVGVHFTTAMAPERIGHRSLATSLSDLAAMGAEPAWATLALTVPEADDRWLSEFSEGFAALASAHGMDLVGGDLTRGPLTVTVQVHGFVPDTGGLRRSGARPGQRVVVTGTVGDAAGGLVCRRESAATTESELDYLLDRFELPTPRVGIGQALSGRACAAIDISDGLLQDLGHILRLSGVGAQIDADSVPRSPILRRVFGDEASLRMALSGGDDYELCFTCELDVLDTLRNDIAAFGVTLTDIGMITHELGLRLVRGGMPWSIDSTGFNHF